MRVQYGETPWETAMDIPTLESSKELRCLSLMVMAYINGVICEGMGEDGKGKVDVPEMGRAACYEFVLNLREAFDEAGFKKAHAKYFKQVN